MKVSTEVTVRLDDTEHFRTPALTRAGLNPVTVRVVEAHTMLGSGKVYVFGPRQTANGWSLNWTRAVTEDLSTFPADVLRALGIDPEEH